MSLVKNVLGAGTSQYTHFLGILKGYRTGEIAVEDVIDQISTVFQGDPELTLGFNTFLPDEYKIELHSNEAAEGSYVEGDNSNKQKKQKATSKRAKVLNDESSIILPQIKRQRLVHHIPKNRVTTSTRVMLSPLSSKKQSSDLLYDYDPLADETFTTWPPRHDVLCKICKEPTDSISNKDPVLLCEQKGCNAEFHLGCLPSNLVTETNGIRNIPEGEIYCKSCAEDGATTVLEKYFDRVDYARSHYSCSRAYVMALLENQMKANPDGNRRIGQKNGNDDLNCPPHSELWGAFELSNLSFSAEEHQENDCESPKSSGASFLVGKPVRLYNNLDNEYHVGRIVDWRSCSAYPDFPGNEPSASDDNHVPINDLPFFGTGMISTCEFLVRFPAGVSGRRKQLLKWIVLEEHSLAVGIRLIEGRTSKTWAPAMILARSSLELVPVRKHLHEDNDTKAKDETEKPLKQFWALASFFGRETHAFLDLNDEARDLISNDIIDGDLSGSNQLSGNSGPNHQYPLASISVPLALALAEKDEQQRCKEWISKMLNDPMHPLTLVASDEYSVEMRLQEERKVLQPIGIGLDRMWLATLANEKLQAFDDSKDALISIEHKPVASISAAMAVLQSKR